MPKRIKVADEHKRQTEIRHQLLANGYRPLPTAEKVAFQKGWPEMVVNKKAIDDWPMAITRWSDGASSLIPAVTTAIQLQGDLLAIDVDVQCQDAADEIDALGYTLFRDDWLTMPMRDSGGSKFMVLCRTETPYAMWKTRKYLDEDGKDHMIEIYGGASTRYFSCFGPHTYGKVVDGQREVLKEYAWADDFSPLNLKPEQLPVIEIEKLQTFMTRAADILATQEGWEPVKLTREGEFEGGVVYDLTDDMEFDVHKYGKVDYQAATNIAAANRDARCSSSFIDGEGSNTQKCRMGVVGDLEEGLELMVFDHETWTTHYHERWKPRTTEEKQEALTDLGDALNRIMPKAAQDAIDEAIEAGVDTEEFEAQVDYLLDSVALDMVTGGVRMLTRPGLIWNSVTLAALKSENAPFDLCWVGPRGGSRRYSPVDAWRASPDKKIVAGVRFDPRTEDRVVRGDDGEMYGNGFFGLPSFEPGTWGDALDNFLTHLVPDSEELEWLLDWLADKYQHPWRRNAGVLFVASGVQGAGRGYLFTILRHVFRYTEHVSESDLLGARFNDFMENSLLLFTNEVGGMGWKARKQGYETLKDRVDPSNDDVTIERKSIPRYSAKTYASFMLATNNPGGLVMDAEDRRIAVITNGGRLEGKLLETMKGVGAERMADQLAWHLSEREVTRDVANAPHFEGRELMLMANDTELDDAIRAVIDEAAPERAWVRSDFEKAVKLKATGSDKGNVPGLRQEVTNLVGKRGDRMGAHLMQKKMKVGDAVLAIVAKKPFHFVALSPDERALAVQGLGPKDDGDNVVPIK